MTHREFPIIPPDVRQLNGISVDINRYPPKPPKGWRRDRDNWLVRQLRAGDPGNEFWTGELNCHGFVHRGRVYARYTELAAEFDRGTK